jgi:hypothetical protein
VSVANDYTKVKPKKGFSQHTHQVGIFPPFPEAIADDLILSNYPRSTPEGELLCFYPSLRKATKIFHFPHALALRAYPADIESDPDDAAGDMGLVTNHHAKQPVP